MLPEGDQYTKKLPWSYRPSHSNAHKRQPSKMSADELLALQIMVSISIQAVFAGLTLTFRLLFSSFRSKKAC